MLFGTVFAGLGCVPLYIAALAVLNVLGFHGWGLAQGKHPWWSIPIVLLLTLTVGGTFTAIGAWIAFGRTGTMIDKAAGAVDTWWCVLCCGRATRYSLKGLDRVYVESVKRSGAFGARMTDYVVFLAGEGKCAVHIATVAPFDWQACEIAAEVRQFIGQTTSTS